MQTASLFFTALAPFALWFLCRRCPQARVGARRSLALILLLFETGELAEKFFGGEGLANYLPMHLCDWVLLAISAALWWDWRLGFELGYFWGLAGTTQAMLTPALPSSIPWWRTFVFFFVHALIVVSVLHLVLTEKMRPRWASLGRVFLCSEFYVAAALLVNWLVDGNYGFLAHRPVQATLLDHFSDTHWLYVLQINALAFLLFPLLYLPWFFGDLWMGRQAPAATGAGSAP